MKTCIYICDKCGAKIEKDHFYISITGVKTFFDFDLCKKCADRLIEDLCEETPEEIAARRGKFLQSLKTQDSGTIGPDPLEDSLSIDDEDDGMWLPEKMQEEETKKQEEQPAKGKKIDCGKALALHNAGWNSWQIAQDMHITAKEAAQAVEQAKSKVFS